MLKRFFCLFFLACTLSLTAQESDAKLIDYGRLEISCSANGPFWKMGLYAFNGAPEVGAFFTYMKKTCGINVAVETGTFRGNTTVFLSYLFDKVYTIEVVESTYKHTARRLEKFPNVQPFHGSSEVVLASLLPELMGERTLFYLDAHWENNWPLLEELEEISKTHYDNCIIVIDNFKVPGRRDIPFDKYEMHECSFEYIKDQLAKVFSEYEFQYIIPRNFQCRAKFVAYPKGWHVQ